jgi:hypothetical protein
MNYKDVVAHDKCLEQLCRGMVRIIGAEIGTLLWGSVRRTVDPELLIKYNELNFEHKIVASMAVQSHDLFQALHLEPYNHRFDYKPYRPLVAAVGMNDNRLFKNAIDFHGTRPEDKGPAWNTFSLMDAVGEALERQNGVKAILKLKKLQETSIIPDEKVYKQWIKLCIETGEVEVLEAVRVIRPRDALKITTRTLQRVCVLRNVEITKIVLADMEFNSSTITTHPLHAAIGT